MMKRLVLNRVLLITLLAAGLAGSMTSVEAKTVYALTSDYRIIHFNSASPGTLTFSAGIVGGLEAPETLKSIAHRSETGQLWGVSNANTLYSVSVANITGFPSAVATPVGSFEGTVAGEKLGMDINLTDNSIRLVTDEGSNLRINDSGELVAQDSTLSPPVGIVDIAYDRNFIGAN